MGSVLNKKYGAYVQTGDVLAYVHSNHPLAKQWLQDFYDAYTFSAVPLAKQPLIHKVLGE